MCVICHQLRNLVGHLVETEVSLNQRRLNMFNYFFVKNDVYSFIIGDNLTKIKLNTNRNAL